MELFDATTRYFCTIYVAKTKALISYAVTHLNCTLFSHMQKSDTLYEPRHDVASVSCFGVRVSVMFHFMFVLYTYSSVWVAEWTPFGK